MIENPNEHMPEKLSKVESPFRYSVAQAGRNYLAREGLSRESWEMNAESADYYIAEMYAGEEITPDVILSTLDYRIVPQFAALVALQHPLITGIPEARLRKKLYLRAAAETYKLSLDKAQHRFKSPLSQIQAKINSDLDAEKNGEIENLQKLQTDLVERKPDLQK